MVAEIHASEQHIQIDRVVAVVDCGVPINPDVVKAQVEGAIGFAISMVLRNQVTLDKGKVQQRNYDDSRSPTRVREMPVVEVHVMNSTERPSGIGEPGVPPLVPAIGNALFAATGKRVRALPFGMKTLTQA